MGRNITIYKAYSVSAGCKAVTPVPVSLTSAQSFIVSVGVLQMLSKQVTTFNQYLVMWGRPSSTNRLLLGLVSR